MNFRLLTFTFIVLSGCQTRHNSSQPKSTLDTTQKVTTLQQKKVGGLYNWTGNLNSSIPVFMWLFIKDSVIKGELTYLKTKKQLPIIILGTITDKGVKIHEFQKDGSVTGTFVGKLKDNLFQGVWYSPSSEKELPFQFTSTDTTLNSIDTSLIPINIPGKYLYQFGKKGSQGGVDIKKTNEVLFSFDISCVTDGPSYNVANVTADSVMITNNRIIYKIPETENCQFRIRFFKDFLVINYIDNQFECGFGLNADIDGIFIKTE